MNNQARIIHQEMIEEYIKGRVSQGHECKFFAAHKDYYVRRWELVFILNEKRTRMLGKKF